MDYSNRQLNPALEKVMIQTLKKAVKALVRASHLMSAIVDAPYYRKALPCQWPPIFLIGPPRSGTTVLYQLILHAYNFAYFSNRANLFYCCPITATQWALKSCKPYSASFKSRYGFERGCLAPNEAGAIWNRWFPHEKKEGFNYTDSDYLPDRSKQKIRNLIAHIERSFDRPFITKNVKGSVRIPALLDIFPNALFIQIQRDLKDAAVSMLIRRRKQHLDWDSVMPKEINQFKGMEDWQEAAHQVHFVEQNIETDIQRLAPKQRLQINYRDLCKNPAKEMERFTAFLESHGVPVTQRANPVPETLHYATQAPNQVVNDEDFKRITECLKSLKSATKGKI